MSARKRHHPATATAAAADITEEPKVKAPEFDTCNFLIEAVSPGFDPNRVLLRRVFFINYEKTRYISVGFYPAHNYQPMVEVGGSKIKPIVLTAQHVSTLADCLPRICESMCDNEQFGRSDGAFRLNTTGSYRIARMYMEKHYITLKFQELRYLLNMFHLVQTQLNSYISALPDVLTFVTNALSSDTYIEPPATASNLILYPHLFEELKTILFPPM